MKQTHYNFQSLSLNWKNLLAITHINIYECDNPIQNFLRGHTYPKVLFVYSGNGRIRLNDLEYNLDKNELFLFNQADFNCTIEPAGEPLHFVVVGINGIEFLTETGDAELIRHYTVTDKDSLYFMDKIVREVRQEQNNYKYASSSFLHLLFIQLNRIYGLSYRITVKEKANRDCEIIRDYIDKHYRENITLDLLAEISNMNKYYMVHSFTNNYGYSPINYLNEKKIDESKLLLETTDYSIAEIAKRIGFSSQSYFSQSFKKHTYMTPNEYRRITKHRP